MDMKKTGRFIAQLRKEKGLTQQALAERMYVTAKTISRWENGNYAPPVDALAPLAELLGTTADEILAGERRRFSEVLDEHTGGAAQKPESSLFSLKERAAFYKKKWLKEHGIWAAVVEAGIVCAALGCGFNKIGWAAGLLLIAAAVFALVERNRMMAYVERNAYDGKGGEDK